MLSAEPLDARYSGGLTRKELDSLQPDAWLDGEIINFLIEFWGLNDERNATSIAVTTWYMKLLEDKAKMNPVRNVEKLTPEIWEYAMNLNAVKVRLCIELAAFIYIEIVIEVWKGVPFMETFYCACAPHKPLVCGCHGLGEEGVHCTGQPEERAHEVQEEFVEGN